ncbi:hypothetical protein [Roseomonas marmotae]|uniref:DUF3618 domain-containing protein n=1 Tax=Roseomonas marmotae TaxID=2768161 RepID=A0ABS3K777_9PROT|nr:hypothetical protein [Roseomonas marmotae]MBO1073318.1 hypothetical protein [Roseomonas marmotae]QTI79065.1 hypothetical protein IAI58_15750 [Roseomonas marmotae]
MSGKPGEESTIDKTRATLQEQGAAVKQEARRVADEVSAEGSKAVEDIKAVGQDLSSAAMEKAEDLAERGKEMGAERGAGLAEATRRVADDLESSSPEIARHVRSAADSIESVSASLRERSVGDLMREASGFARRQPTAFFGAAVVAGFALARFAKSSSDGQAGTTGTRGLTGRTGMPGGTGIAGGAATTDRAPGWVPGGTGSAAGTAPLQPATMPAATLGGAVAHKPGTAAPGSMPTIDETGSGGRTS